MNFDDALEIHYFMSMCIQAAFLTRNI